VEAIISAGPVLTAERRADCRYPIHAGLEYRIIVGRKVVRTGTGSLLNISRGGLLFECAQAIAPDSRIELDIEWPAQAVKMVLRVAGQTVRSEGLRTAVRILRSSFLVHPDKAGHARRPRNSAW